MKKKLLFKNVRILNLISGIAAQFVTAASGIVLPNLILHTYGSALNGLVTTVTQMLAYLSIVEMGIMHVSLVALYKPMANEDYVQASAIMSAVNRFYHRIAALFSAGAVICGFLAIVLIKDDIPSATIWLVTLALAGTNFVSYWFLSKYKVLLQADDKLYIVNTAHAIGVSIQFVLSVLVIRTNANIAAVKAIIIVTNLIEYVILYHYSKKKHPKISLKVPPALGAIKQRKDILVHQVLALVLNNTDVLLLTIFSESLTSVSIYSIYNMISLLIHNVANTVIGMFSARMGQMYAQQRYSDVRDILRKYEVVYSIALFGLYICMALLVMPFISVYTKGVTDAQYYDPTIGLLFSIFGITRMQRLPYSELTSAAGHFKQTKNQAIIEVLVNLIVSVVLLPFWGIAGVLVGSIAGEAYRTIHTYYYCNKKLVSFDWLRSLLLLLLNIVVFVLFFIAFSNSRSKILSSYVDFMLLSIKVVMIVFPTVLLLNVALAFAYGRLKHRR